MDGKYLRSRCQYNGAKPRTAIAPPSSGIPAADKMRPPITVATVTHQYITQFTGGYAPRSAICPSPVQRPAFAKPGERQDKEIYRSRQMPEARIGPGAP